MFDIFHIKIKMYGSNWTPLEGLRMFTGSFQLLHLNQQALHPSVALAGPCSPTCANSLGLLSPDSLYSPGPKILVGL